MNNYILQPKTQKGQREATMTTTFNAGNQITLADDIDQTMLTIAEGNGITKETILPIESVRGVAEAKGNPRAVGHHQWVSVKLPNGIIKEFSGEYFKIAPGGRINEVEIDK